MKRLKAGLIQMKIVSSKEENLNKAGNMVKRATDMGAELIILPEMFNCPYNTSNFPEYAEKEGEYSWKRLSDMARLNKRFLVGGSIPEIDENGRVYNTSYIFDDSGNQIGKHRKIHLFDIDIEGGQYFKESDTLNPGNDVTIFETPYGKMGIAICYDIRFPELSRLMAEKGARVIIIPGAFNMTTGPAHWEILFRARALDNQVYMIGVAPARDCSSGYVSYGNSIIVDPWGSVVNKLNEEENILIDEIDFEKVIKIRQELPLLKHIRKDVYDLREV